MKIKKGFTFIELLVALAIIGVFATFFIATYPGSQRRARDTRRKSDLKQYQNSLENYANNNNNFYPARLTTIDITELCGIIDVSLCPDDPRVTQGQETYKYQTDSDGVRYVLWAKLEATDEYWVNCSGGNTEKTASPISVSGGNCPL